MEILTNICLTVLWATTKHGLGWSSHIYECEVSRALGLHLRSIVARVEAGAEILLLDAWHMSVAPRSSRVTWGTDKVFWTVLLNVFSKLESIKWLSLHQVTWGIGSPESSQKKYNFLVNTHYLRAKPYHLGYKVIILMLIFTSYWS